MEPKLQHIGLGKEEAIDVEILWPNGERQAVRGLEARESYLIEQGKAPAASPPLETAR